MPENVARLQQTSSRYHRAWRPGRSSFAADFTTAAWAQATARTTGTPALAEINRL